MNMWSGIINVSIRFKQTQTCRGCVYPSGWMFGKLRKGYAVIDIGITTTHRGMGWYYGIERFVMAQWKYRNIWKLPVNLFL